MRKRMCLVFLFGMTMAVISSGCNSSVGTTTGGSFSSCYVIGFSNQDITSIYDAAIIDRTNGFTYNEENQAATNACIESCNYEGVCANGCASCANEIIAVAYSKLREQPAKSSISENPTIGIIIKDLP